MKKITYLDCTFRDGGYYNNWDFSRQKAKEIIDSLNKAKVDIIEVGYKSKRSDKYSGLFKYCNENGFDGNRSVFMVVNNYLKKRKRKENEYLISDIEKKEPYYSYYNELNEFLKREFDTEFISLNSGFSMLMLITYMANVLDLPVQIYGLDFGLGGYEYFDGSKIDKHCSYNDFSKDRVKEFLKKVYLNKNISVENHSYFQTMIS